MKQLVAIAVAVTGLAFLVSGCTQGTGKSKGGDKQLTVKAKESHSVKRGDKESIDVTVNRDGFDDDVTIAIENLPEGVTLQDTNMKIAKGEKSATFTLKAANDAKAVTDHPVKITGKSGDIKTAEATVKLTVKE